MTERSDVLIDSIACYVAQLDVIQPYLRTGPSGAFIKGLDHPGSLPNAEQLASFLLADGEFRALQLGTWLGTPDGQLLTEAVSRVIPRGYQALFALVVDGLQLAADEQAREGRAKAGAVALAVLVVGSLVALIAYEK